MSVKEGPWLSELPKVLHLINKGKRRGIGGANVSGITHPWRQHSSKNEKKDDKKVIAFYAEREFRP